MSKPTLEQIKLIGKQRLGREITDQEANKFLNGEELSDDELQAVSGGGCGESQSFDPVRDTPSTHY